jgi:ethanolamine utilization protein EutA
MSDREERKRKRGHSLADHQYGQDFGHVHDDEEDVDHDHDDLTASGALEDNPIWQNEYQRHGDVGRSEKT